MDNKNPTILIYKKFSDEKISEHLSVQEMECKCDNNDCNFLLVDQKIIDSFEKLRVSCGNKPIEIRSCHRCQIHNKNVGGVDNSRHLIGHALDLEPPKSIELDEFEYRANKFFDCVIKYYNENFLHVHFNP